MPRNVRNFWLELTVDGKTSRVETGPQARDGGFRLVILQRDKGGIIRAMEVDGRATSMGLVLEATASHDSGPEDTGLRQIQVRTER